MIPRDLSQNEEFLLKVGVSTSGKGGPIGNLANAVKVIDGHPLLNNIWYDEFYQKILTAMTKDGRAREWSDADDLELTELLQANFGFQRISPDTVGQAVRLVSRKHVKNDPRDWMKNLTWDGIPRVEHFFIDCFSAEDNAYVRQAALNFWVSIAARVFNPGCQMDNMIVLEGDQGIGKSQALRAIGRQWYTEASESVTTKDFFLLLPGKLIIEIAELDSFNKAEATRIKQVISCGVDRYRAPYGHHSEDHPRMSVFVGSTNDHEYLKDHTGGRRFWPVRCHGIRIDLIEASREQFFAEAVHLLKSNVEWWKMPAAMTREMQEERRLSDPWEDTIQTYIKDLDQVTISEISNGCLGLEHKAQNSGTSRRIGNILRQLKWEKSQKMVDGLRPKVWKPIKDLVLI